MMFSYIRKEYAVIVAAALMLLMSPLDGVAQFDYGFSVERGERMVEEWNVLQDGSRAGACQTQRGNRPSEDRIRIGFIFRFDGRDYEEVSVNSNGILTFNEPVADPGNNSLENLSTPVLAPFWDVMRLPGGENGCDRRGMVQYAIVGKEPDRILVVDYYDPSLGDGCSDGVYVPVQFQVRLYEGSNRIEFYYEEMNPNSPDCFRGPSANTTASIGIGSENGFISIVPQNGSEAVSSTVRDEGSVDLQANGIDRGVIYSFCPASVVGNPDEGGTIGMQDKDVLFEGMSFVRYSGRTFQPFTLRSFCATNFNYFIEGPSADEYFIDPVEGELDPEKGNTPTITFRPTGLGVREATLVVRDDLGYVARTYTLAGEGTTRVTYVGNVDQGGTADMNDGDVLMTEIKVRNGSSGDFTPISIEVLPADQFGAPDAPVTYTLIDPTGQFSIDRTVDNVAPGGVSTPVITFSPNNSIDVQSATLIVDAEGEIRTFQLRPFSSGPGARFIVSGDPFVNGSAMMRGVFGCVGESSFTTPFEITAIGDEPFVIESLDAFQVNSEVTQGTPPSPIIRDPFGQPLHMSDYFIADAPDATLPLEFPIVINPGERKTVYLTFVPTRPGKRAARTFFRTNGENFAGVDVDRQDVRGMLNMEMVGHGMGGVLNNRAGNGLPKPILFANTDVRGSSAAVGYVRNSGDCDLRIDRDAFRLVSGDINEFSIVSVFPNSSIDPTTGDYIIPPGGIDSVTVSFTPIRSGSRRASLRLATNDSLVLIGGVVARGEYYIDLFGVGNVGLEAHTLTLPPAIINGPSSTGQTMIENTSGELLQITNIRVVNGGTEIVEDPANAWPLLPLTVAPGQKIPLGLLLNPDPAVGPGVRTATVEVTLSNGNILTIDVKGLAGTRTLSATPAALFQGARVPVGEVRRGFALLTNTGTFPVTIAGYQLTGVSKDDYAVQAISRHIVEPGEMLPIEVVYTPSIQGASSAVLEFTTNSTDGTPAGTHVVVLGGEGTSTAIGGDPFGSSATIPGPGEEFGRPDVSQYNVSVARLHDVQPNPVRGNATIRFDLPVEGDVVIDLYDVEGRLAKNLAVGQHGEGQHTLQADLGNLPSGSYYVRFEFGGRAMTTVMNLVR